MIPRARRTDRTGRDDDLPFRIELWDDQDRYVEEVIALVSDFTTAQSTYNEAVKRQPGKLITLRQKARVIKQSRKAAIATTAVLESVPARRGEQ
jgi:hypothetical protein